MSNITITFAGATMAALRASVAEFLGAGNIPTTSGGDDDDSGPVNTAAPTVDGDGVPWDDRIHSSNKQLTDGGKWRKKRGVNDGYYQQITNELKARATTAPATAPATMPQTAPATMPTTMPGAPLPGPGMTPTQPVGMQFGDLMQKYNAALGAGKVTQQEFTSYHQSMGFADLSALATNPEKILELHNWMLANGKL